QWSSSKRLSGKSNRYHSHSRNLMCGSNYSFLYVLFCRMRRPPTSPLFPYTTLFRSVTLKPEASLSVYPGGEAAYTASELAERTGDRKSTRLNSSHVKISYAVFCVKKKKEEKDISIEPMINLQRHTADKEKDGWTLKS